MTKEDLEATTGTPQETSTRLTWQLQCQADLEVKFHAKAHEARRYKAALEEIAGPIPDGQSAEWYHGLCERVVLIAERALATSP